MSLQECIELAKKVGTAYVATDDNGQPRVRALGLWFADESGFYFQIWTIKNIYKQLQKNQNMEVCFYEAGEGGGLGRMLRISGKAEILEDKTLKEKVLVDRPFLKMVGFESADDPRLAIFRIAHGEAFIWTMQYTGKEAEIPRVKF